MSAVPSGRASFEGDLWRGVARLVDRASVAGLRAHRLDGLAVERWHALGRPVPAALRAAARTAAVSALAAPQVLAAVRAAWAGPMLLVKGPEVAALYPRPGLRPFSDLDLLVPDPPAVQRALVRAGFVPVGDAQRYADCHHLQPLQRPGCPLKVEVHGRLKWIDGLPPPAPEELFACAVPSVTGVADLWTLPRPQHAVVLAAHSWAHSPLGSALQLIDIAAVIDHVPRALPEAVARRWRLERVWRLTARAIDAVLYRGRTPWPLRLWARDLARVRGRSVLETHLGHWLAGFSAFPVRRAVGAALVALGRDCRPVGRESWGGKLRRTGRALCGPFAPPSQGAEPPAG